MVSLSCLTSPLSNCYTKISTSCSESKEGIMAAAKVSVYVISATAVLFAPIPDPAKVSIANTLCFMALSTITTHPGAFNDPPPTDRNGLRVSASIAANAGLGALGGYIGGKWSIALYSLGWAAGLYITHDRKICCPPEDRYHSLNSEILLPGSIPTIEEETPV